MSSKGWLEIGKMRKLPVPEFRTGVKHRYLIIITHWIFENLQRSMLRYDRITYFQIDTTELEVEQVSTGLIR